MNFTLGWFWGAAVFLLFLAAFMFTALKSHQKKQRKISPTPAYPLEEFSAEITFPAPVSTIKTTGKPDMPEIPWHYGLDRLVLMVRDPNWIFAYWEITATKQEEFNQQYGARAWPNTQPVLRVYDITGVDSFDGTNANKYIDIFIPNMVDSWHIEINQPDCSFCVDLGRLFPDGKFVTLLRSNIVYTPSASISNLLDEEWMWVQGIYQTITQLHLGSSPMLTEQKQLEIKLPPLNVSSPGRHKH